MQNMPMPGGKHFRMTVLFLGQKEISKKFTKSKFILCYNIKLVF